MKYCNGVIATAALAALALAASGCAKKANHEEASSAMPFKHMAADTLAMQLARFAPVEVSYDESILSASEKDALAKLAQVSGLIDELFLRQVWNGSIAMRNELAKDAQIAGPNQALAQNLFRSF